MPFINGLLKKKGLQQAVRLHGLAVDLDLSRPARLLGLGARAVEAGDVEPHVDPRAVTAVRGCGLLLLAHPAFSMPPVRVQGP
jgi:hypothetical protein